MRAHGRSAIWSWLILWGLYLLLAGAINPAELVFGAAVALISTAVFRIAHHHSPAHFVAIKNCLRPLSRLPGKVFADCAIVLLAIWSRKSGRFREIKFNPGNRSNVSATRRALVVVGASLAPNSFVVRLSFERGTLLLHEFVIRPDRTRDEEWPL
ncbi:MAG TPA: Na+/H+ antiporter subunit E [Chthoniobacterales bacterium]|jgi:hypothetical protein|nr:Na+/H+ antiporter subunit E [Chthoniobacterales bacterium]